MFHRKLTTLLLLVALFATGVGVLLSVASVWVQIPTRWRASMPDTQRVTLPAVSGQIPATDLGLVDLGTRAGVIEVRADEEAGGTALVRYTARRAASGPDEASARASAAALQPVATIEGSELRLEVVVDEEALGDVSRGRVDWQVSVPAGMALRVHSIAGDIQLTGGLGAVEVDGRAGRVDVQQTRGPLLVRSRFGDVRVEGHRGALVVTSTGGSVSLFHVTAEGAVARARTELGALSASQVSADGLDLFTATGRLSAEELRASGPITLESRFGGLEVERVVARALTARSRGGSIRVDTGELSGSLKVDGGSGDVFVSGVEAGSFELRSDHGRQELVGAAGPVRMASQGGDLGLTTSRSVAPELRSVAGDIRFEGPWRGGGESPRGFWSNFGDVRVSIPESVDADVTLESRFGEIHDELRLEDRRVEPGRVRGRLGAGGPSLEIRSTGGDLWLQPWRPSSREG